MSHPRTLLALAVALSTTATAQTTVTFWDFFAGGDGARMKQIVDDFNKSQKDIVVQRTTLTWGAPFYTKIHTAVVAGQTPDVMTYHLSHLPAGLAQKDLRPITTAELSAAGLNPKDFQANLVQTMTGDARTQTGQAAWYGVPLDTHTFTVYYNKDLLKKAGLLGADGKPAAMNTVADLTRALQTIKQKTGVVPIALGSNQDPASVWRLWYTLFLQQGGTLDKNGKLNLADLDTKGKAALQVMADWSRDGLLSKNTTYPATVALFTSGRTAMMLNGNWEVPTMVDAKTKGQLRFDYGITSFPKLYGATSTWADSHMLAIPANAKKPMSAEKLNAALKFIAYANKQGGLTWAGGGHIPAYLPTQNNAKFKTLQPNVQFSATAAKNAKLEPTITMFGVGGPVYDAVGNAFTPVLLGQLPVDQGIAKFKTALQGFNK
ncbi:extracellular solute-binding protein [Deinococcus maricopensis]|uniref:Extracellular solute-binding protein family 1 n=1 Tax=Deinococcus maricopensis (strain DSM 21211 / LMG 22137 / NRRL B-23946 / LB-34) TaxID=709986 RepID=E8U484_DEIML|nr:extracellular solute-binding protein [Deinococcus maricopensis]ADV65921.1 extracellular solute-binding protein family 1 [Deinococcus maricopensis DSM 21211]